MCWTWCWERVCIGVGGMRGGEERVPSSSGEQQQEKQLAASISQ